MDAGTEPRVVLIHDWLTGMRGGEKCLEAACRRWPEAPLYTLLHKSGSVSPTIEDRPLRTSWLQCLPGVHKFYRYLLPFMPSAVGWSLPRCDLVLSFSHCVAKGVRPPSGVPHFCYCFTPMRYAWHMKDAYFGEKRRGIKSRIVDWLMRRMREWDRRTAANVTHFIAISKTVQQRIAECYGRDSVVIYPPVDTEFYCPAPVERENFYLVVSAFAPYKRVELAVEACAKRKQGLIVIGTGQDQARLRAMAGPNAQFLGWQSDEVIRDHMRRCKALLFPGEEDFGIVPVEAMACGAPVIAYGRGGATETVVPPGGRDEPTGIWFEEQTVDSLLDAMEKLDRRRGDLSPNAARLKAQWFNQQRFEDELFGFVDMVIGTKARAGREAA